MKKPRTNSQNVPVDTYGYILCQSCGRAVQEISKETRLEYAYCVEHRPNRKELTS